jgi:tripartite-type tricarboxylate transporter receptor subunit TctC
MTKLAQALLVAAAALTGLPGIATAQKVTTIIVPSSAGDMHDVLARLVAEKMRTGLGHPVIVENRPGAGGIVGTQFAKSGKPDGSVVVIQALAPMVTYPYTHASVPYDPFKDFVPVCHLVNFDLAFGISKDVPAKSLAEYAKLVKSDAKYRFYGSPGAGSLPHFFGLLVGKALGVEMKHTAYKGGSPAVQAVMSGEIPAVITVSSGIVNASRDGSVRLIAVSGPRRNPSFPDVPTFKEAGFDIEGTGWWAMFAPAKTPQATIDQLARAASEAVKSDGVREKLTAAGLQVTGYGPADLGRVLKADHERWAPVINASGFKASQ